MAGIGFELRHMLRKNTLLSVVQAYAYAGVIGSGPWVFSIVGILLIGIFSASVVVPGYLVTQFQTSVTYLVASSLILTGLVQLAFTRFISDRLFEKQQEMVLANLHGLLLIVMLVSGVLGSVALFVVLPGQGLLYRLLMLAGFTLMCGVWILTVLLSGMKRYKAIVVLFGLSYLLIVAGALFMRRWGLEGLLGGFVLGNYVLLAGMWLLVVAGATAQAGEVEVLHWWTSGGEAKSVGELKKIMQGKGHTWKDFAVAGGGGDNAMTVLKSRAGSSSMPKQARRIS